MTVKAQIRRTLDRVDNEEVRIARRLAWNSRRAGIDVLHLGDSTVEWIAPTDHDRRPLWAMLAEQVRKPYRYHALYGGSYSAEIHEAYARLALADHRPRMILVPLWYRGRLLPWMRHPVYSRARAVAAINTMDASTPYWRIHRSFTRPRKQEWDDFYALPFDTFADLSTVGEYITRLKDPVWSARDPEGRAKLIYAYHLTHRIQPDGPELDGVRQLGRTLREAACPVVVYENPSPVRTGRQYWGADFTTVAEANFGALRDALRAGYGSDLEILQTGMTFSTEEFLDPALADEHLNERGRIHLARMIVDRMRSLEPSLVRAPRG